MTVSLPELCRLRVGFLRIHEATHCYVVYVAGIANRYLLMLFEKRRTVSDKLVAEDPRNGCPERMCIVLMQTFSRNVRTRGHCQTYKQAQQPAEMSFRREQTYTRSPTYLIDIDPAHRIRVPVITSKGRLMERRVHHRHKNDDDLTLTRQGWL